MVRNAPDLDILRKLSENLTKKGLTKGIAGHSDFDCSMKYLESTVLTQVLLQQLMLINSKGGKTENKLHYIISFGKFPL